MRIVERSQRSKMEAGLEKYIVAEVAEVPKVRAFTGRVRDGE